ncbi:MarR family transcriptional regulator [Pedobacter sp. KBW06]|uniref:MarR family winged helix-turn-helix transcriptional regulator n=1 Tax=Pedobacter sp. KBW06 TaxID=2153359 RepID=UPI000F5AC82E|nr:MarR family transcriptional regulator [Pedobacter sp. KBW06]RQO65988.1 MarR family transcriptional regulator [Pedobacter sp. KBW06]
MISENLNSALAIIKTQAILSKKFDKLNIHGLGLSDFIILYLLKNSPNNQCRRIDLADRMGITASGITRLLAPMEKIGLVDRQSNTRDARVSYAVLTNVGEQIFEEAKITAEEVAEEIFSSLKKKNQGILLDVLNDLIAKFN